MRMEEMPGTTARRGMRENRDTARPAVPGG